jgi:predicted metalloprotease
VHSLRRIRGLVYLLMAFSALILPIADIAYASPPAQQTDEQQGAGESGVVGNSYTSPSFGYSITWDRTWSVSDEKNEPDANSLTLTNDTTIVTLESVLDKTDIASCVETFADAFAAGDGISDFEQMELEDGPAAGEEAGRNWAVYNFTYTAESSDSIDFALYVDCRSIVEAESLLVIYAFIPADAFDSQVEPLGELLQGLSMDGSTGPSTDEPEDAGTNGDTSDLGRFIQISADDINTFWTREFPLISGGTEYTPPADVIPFDADVETDCGTIAVMEVGPAYCPFDQTIYYDLAFAQGQVDNFGSTSVIAVVMAHETGHHIQNLMQWKECEQTPCLDPMEMTSQEFELQADCFAGAWLADAETRGRLGSFDIETNIAQFALILGDQGTGNTADPGAHGKAARRVFEFLNGYYNGVTECLKISAASDPARNGGANANTNSVDPTATPDEPTPEAEKPTKTADEPTPTSKAGTDELIQIGDEYEIELRNATLSMTVTSTQAIDDLGGGFEADGTYLVVAFTLERDAETAGPFTYNSFILTDSDGNEYEFDEAATDAVLKTAETLPDGIDQDIESGQRYKLVIIYDVPTDASGFVFSTSNGDFPVELDV